MPKQCAVIPITWYVAPCVPQKPLDVYQTFPSSRAGSGNEITYCYTYFITLNLDLYNECRLCGEEYVRCSVWLGLHLWVSTNSCTTKQQDSYVLISMSSYGGQDVDSRRVVLISAHQQRDYLSQLEKSTRLMVLSLSLPVSYHDFLRVGEPRRLGSTYISSSRPISPLLPALEHNDTLSVEKSWKKG